MNVRLAVVVAIGLVIGAAAAITVFPDARRGSCVLGSNRERKGPRRRSLQPYR